MRALAITVTMLMFTLSAAAKQPDSSVLRISFVGDIMTHDSQINGARTTSGDYDFHHCFEQVAPLLRKADIAVGNLETPCAMGDPGGYPAFNAPAALLDALRDAGFDVLNLANNHACDQGAIGLAETIEAVSTRGMRSVGVLNQQPLILESQGVRVWMSAYTYGSNRALGDPRPAFINAERIRADLVASDADVRIVILHWGAEYRRTPEAANVALADSILVWGADAVIGGHPHVIQPMRRDARGFVAFSLGNFISGQREGNPGVRYTEDGVILSLTFSRNAEGDVRLTGIDTEPTWVDRQRRADGSWRYRVLPTSSTDKRDDALREKLDQSAKDTREVLHKPVETNQP